MPQGDGTGPDGKGPKSSNRGWPERYDKPDRRQAKGKGWEERSYKEDRRQKKGMRKSRSF